MIKNYIHIAITVIVTFTLISVGYLIAQKITNTELYYDAGIAAYQRGHYRVALYDFESRAKRGDKVAQFCLAFMYKHGYGVTESKPEEALKWYTKAAEQGYTPAQNNLGVLFVRRAEVAADKSALLENFEIARKWFEIAAEQGYLPAQFNLYILLPDEHVDWLRKAAARGYPPAQSELGVRHYSAKDFETAVEWYTKAAEQDYPTAQYNLGLCYETGNGMKQNYEKAVDWFEMAAKQGYPPAQYSLGLFYRYGWGVAKSPTNAFRWFFQAAKQNHIVSQNNLAVMYAEGRGVPKNLEMANRWYLRSAQQGVTIAQSNIGVKFEKGQGGIKGRGGIPQDGEEAYFWYSLALQNKTDFKWSDNKDRVAKMIKAHDRFRKSLNPEQIAEINARIENWKPKHLYSTGTGIYVDKHYILTNAHVVIDKNTGKPWGEFRIPYRRVELVIEGWDRDLDLALLYDKRGNMNAATFRREPVKLGEKASVFGYPRSDLLSYKGNVALGIVSGISYLVDHPQFANRFQYTAPTQRGNSGGPVFDSAGNVIGVYTEQMVDYESFVAKNWVPQTINLAQNANFAIKFSVIKDYLLNHLISPLMDAYPTAGDISNEELSNRAVKFTVPVLCFKDKAEQFSEVGEVTIDTLE